MNELKRKFSLDSRECRLLMAEFGDKNVESTLIYVQGACDRQGLCVMIPPTYEMVRDALEAVHGRLDVGSVRFERGGSDAFYHHPDGAAEPPAETGTG